MEKYDNCYTQNKVEKSSHFPQFLLLVIVLTMVTISEANGLIQSYMMIHLY